MFRRALILILVIITQLLVMEFALSHALPPISESLILIFVGYADGANMVTLLEIGLACILAHMIGLALEGNVFSHVPQEPMPTSKQIFV